MPPKPTRITAWLEAAPTAVFALYATGTAFATYFCMYAFRKPFAAATFEGVTFLGTAIGLKTALVISQILGYTLSKYIGIKVCSEVTRGRRAGLLVGLILAAELALLLFAVLPPDLQVVAIFLNGLPLGMVWGLVVWYLEGRRTSELLLAGLSCSFIVSSGVVKDVGRALIDHGVPEAWMPAAAGLLFLPLFLLFVWLLNQLPPPSAADMAARVRREPMDASHRRAFLKHYLPGLVLLLIVYFFLTAYRDFRDNYGVEIFSELGYSGQPAVFTRSEIPVAFGVMAAMAALNLIKDNRLGLLGVYATMTSGVALLGVGTLLFDAGYLSGLAWMVLVGLGSYLAYVPYGSVLFDRLMASTRFVGTAVFAIYVADAIGYTGSVGVQLYKDLAEADATRFGFFWGFTYVMALLGVVLLAASGVYFLLRPGRQAG
jgi:hypothetical protein